MKVALCVIATGKYGRFLPELLRTAGEFFCTGHEVRLFVFSDVSKEVASGQWIVDSGNSPSTIHQSLTTIHVPHEAWPGPTLHRYRTMLTAVAELAQCDFIYHVDVDSRFVRPVGEEIFGDLAATIHFGFCDKPRSAFTYEFRPASRAYVHPREGRRYYAGGFQGGRADCYLAAMRTMAEAIADDARRGIIACWHDESHWNRYLIDHRPTLELGHEYNCPAAWRLETQRIVILGKNNQEVRT